MRTSGLASLETSAPCPCASSPVHERCCSPAGRLRSPSLRPRRWSTRTARPRATDPASPRPPRRGRPDFQRLGAFADALRTEVQAASIPSMHTANGAAHLGRPVVSELIVVSTHGLQTGSPVISGFARRSLIGIGNRQPGCLRVVELASHRDSPSSPMPPVVTPKRYMSLRRLP